MDTKHIYEDLRGPLGDEAARCLTRTFAEVFTELHDSVTREDFRILRESIDDNVSRLDRALTGLAEAQVRTESRVEELARAQARTESRVEELAQAQARTESRVEELAQAQARTEARIEELAQAQARTEARVEELAQAQARTEARVEELAQAQARTEVVVARLLESQSQMQDAIRRLTIRTDALVGRTFELQFRDRIASYLGLFMRRCRLVDVGDLIDTLEAHLSQDEISDVLRSDAVAIGIVNGVTTHVVVEVSSTADADDVARVRRWADMMARAGLPAIGMVACESIAPECLELSDEAGVRVWRNGRLLEPGSAA
jgi:flagellar biosynthesis GTPase FlhF